MIPAIVGRLFFNMIGRPWLLKRMQETLWADWQLEHTSNGKKNRRLPSPHMLTSEQVWSIQNSHHLGEPQRLLVLFTAPRPLERTNG